ncbi:MAG TPA: hypothetical protein VMP11_16720 [Verrucomicrobiae bacterium]|nr:hypothetical protein [Verrucomicrobiae bacterium]
MAANANHPDPEPQPQTDSGPVSSGGILPWLMPSLTQWLWLVILLILLANPWRTMMATSDGDTCMHWRVGEYMLETGHLIRTDVFSHTRFGEPIISKEWLAEIIFALAGRAWGLYGLCVVTALLIATTFALLHRQLVRESGNHAVAILVAFIAAWAACAHWLARPHAFSFLLAVLWSDALRRFDRGESARRLLIMLGVLTLLWVNLHGGYLAGFVTLGIYWLGTIIELVLSRTDQVRWSEAMRKLMVFTGAIALCGGVSLANPSGYELHVHNLHFLRSQYLTNWLAEYASSDFHAFDSHGFLAWLALTFLTLALARPRLSPSSGLLLIVWTYFGLYAVRNIPLTVIFVAPILATSLADASPSYVRRLSDRMREVYEMSRAWPLVGLVAIVAIVAFPRPTEIPAKKWPVDAVAYIHAHPDQFKGNMFNLYIWGGYLMYALPEHRVFVDGRTDFYGESLIRQYDDTSLLHTNWQQPLAQYRVDWTIMPTDHRLNLALALLPGWHCVYSNEVAAIFRKQP